MGKTIECPVHAKIVPFSSVVGQSVMLTDETGAVVAHISISIPSPSYPYRETAGEVACIIETAINRPPSEQIKNLRVRLGKLMADEAKRMAASELATPSPAPVSAPATDGEVMEKARAAVERLANVQMNLSLEEWSKLSGDILAALSNPAPGHGEAVPVGHVEIAHDGFAGDIIGHYETREGKRGVVVQQDGTRVVHVYGEKWIAHPATGEKPAKPEDGDV